MTTELKSVEPQVAQMESKIFQAQSAFDRVKASFPDIDVVTFGERLLKLADQHSLQVVKVSSSQPVLDRRDSVTFLATNVEIELQGKTSDIIAFVHVLLTDQSFVSTLVNKLDASGMNQELSAISISLAFYSYTGS